MCKSYFVLYTCDDFKQNLFDVDIFGRRHYLYEQKVARMTWKIDYKDLLMAKSESDIPASDKTVRDIRTSELFINYILT